MWALLRRLLPSSRSPEHPPAQPTGGEYRSASYLPLRPWQVRGRQFGMAWHGLNPAEVGTFLDRVATDLSALYTELARSREETALVKEALRDWQSRQAPTSRELASR